LYENPLNEHFCFESSVGFGLMLEAIFEELEERFERGMGEY